MLSRSVLALAALGFAAGCNTLTPATTAESHCSRVLKALIGNARYSEDEVQERDRIDGAERLRAVTIVYVEGGDTRRLMTCLYAPGEPNRAVGISYRGERLSPQRVGDINAAVARR